MDDGFTILHRDDFEHAGPKWGLARRSLGLKAFGMNCVDLQPGEKIPEHDETERDQEEVFVVLSGAPTMVIKGREYPVRAGTFVRLAPEPLRTVRNDGSETASLLVISAPCSSGFEPMDWC